MKRDIYQKLLAWKESHRRKPLILKGARQVGKTYILEAFARQSYEHFVYLNFDETPEFASLFKGGLDPQRIIHHLNTYFNTKVEPQKTLIIFDEIQECSDALSSLKYFSEKANEYHIVSAGSLLGVKLNRHKGFPVGKVNFIDLYPMSFCEFLDAIGKSNLRQLLDKNKSGEKLPDIFHNEFVGLLKQYFFIGGMPEAVKEFCETKDFNNVRTVQKEILNAYILDFAKYATASEAEKITLVWESIPTQLAKENKKFIFSIIKKSARGREYVSAIQWLADAGLIYKSYCLKTAKLPLDAYTDKQAFKLFLLDVGLLGAMSKLPQQAILDETRLFVEFKGALTENFVASECMSSIDDQLHYWASQGIAEVDFVLAVGDAIIPLEAKSGLSKKKKSLKVYTEKYKPKTIVRSNLLNYAKDGNLVNIPLYAVSKLLTVFKGGSRGA